MTNGNRLTRLGTKYGGNRVDLDLIPEGSTIISAGVGEDISFDLELIRLKGCRIIGIDPTEKSKRYILSKFQNLLIKPDNFVFINKALVSNDRAGQKLKMYVNKNPKHVSDSEVSSHRAASNKFYMADTITLNELFSKYENISLIKLDIEGSEYKMIDDVIASNVQQTSIEFHHSCSGYSSGDTEAAAKSIVSSGYYRFGNTFINKNKN
jgi:FkbM family methyltransferase